MCHWIPLHANLFFYGARCNYLAFLSLSQGKQEPVCRHLSCSHTHSYLSLMKNSTRFMASTNCNLPIKTHFVCEQPIKCLFLHKIFSSCIGIFTVWAMMRQNVYLCTQKVIKKPLSLCAKVLLKSIKRPCLAESSMLMCVFYIITVLGWVDAGDYFHLI